MYTSLSYEYDMYQNVEIQVDKETNTVSKVDIRNMIAYGEPSRVYDGEMYTSLSYEYDMYQNVEIQVDKETNTVSKVDIRNMIATASEADQAQAASQVSYDLNV